MTENAEQFAARKGLPVVLLLPFDAKCVASGNPMVVSTADGAEVLVRLFTADEWQATNERAAREHGVPPASRADAERLTKPLPI